jgi:hypothetical protein
MTPTNILNKLSPQARQEVIRIEARLSEIQIAKNENNLLDMMSEEGI